MVKIVVDELEIETEPRMSEPLNITKVQMLQMYTKVIAGDAKLWFITKIPNELYLQNELHHLSWMIEEANIEEIGEEITKKKEELDV